MENKKDLNLKRHADKRLMGAFGLLHTVSVPMHTVISTPDSSLESYIL
jgi:hypothetical protein